MIHIITTKDGLHYRLADTESITAIQEAALIEDHLSGQNPHPIWTVTGRKVYRHGDISWRESAFTTEVFYSQIESIHLRETGAVAGLL